jgi:hypothetical protein
MYVYIHYYFNERGRKKNGLERTLYGLNMADLFMCSMHVRFLHFVSKRKPFNNLCIKNVAL